MSNFGLKQGQNVGKFQLINLLSDKRSDVWHAKDTVIGREVALKLLACDDSDLPDRIREAFIGGNTNHEGLCPVLEADRVQVAHDSNLVLIAYEFLSSGTASVLA